MRHQSPRYDRLLALAAFLEKLPRRRFNYETWLGADWDGQPDLSCGTTACAFGWACTIEPNLRWLPPGAGGRTTLRLRVLRGPYRGNYNEPLIVASIHYRLPRGVARWLFKPGYDGMLSDWLTLFRISDRLFVPWPAPQATASAKQVAKHICRVVAWLRREEQDFRDRRAASRLR